MEFKTFHRTAANLSFREAIVEANAAIFDEQLSSQPMFLWQENVGGAVFVFEGVVQNPEEVYNVLSKKIEEEGFVKTQRLNSSEASKFLNSWVFLITCESVPK